MTAADHRDCEHVDWTPEQLAAVRQVVRTLTRTHPLRVAGPAVEDDEPLGLCEFHPGGPGAGCDRDAVTNVGGEDLCRFHVEALYGREPEEKE